MTSTMHHAALHFIGTNNFYIAHNRHIPNVRSDTVQFYINLGLLQNNYVNKNVIINSRSQIEAALKNLKMIIVATATIRALTVCKKKKK